jgi:hypothetical protein
MRENRPYGSEGGESGSTGLPYPYLLIAEGDTHFRVARPRGFAMGVEEYY